MHRRRRIAVPWRGALTQLRWRLAVALFWLTLRVMPRGQFYDYFIDAIASIRAKYPRANRSNPA